ncbi:probable Ufm1-specific protease 1 isoform X1 [Sitodiplosis mosellana]|uniref:probable Ufm1-specific protease 1 isoform X1 n=1 Tax=Sitodiplosis mosellana TaxID=263140 RepID=UPI00244466D6|nr:probable Ufm1-specific protease 1 isoform X1 [Sitodiplosis mosellana]
MTLDLLQIVPSEIPRPSKHGKSYFSKGDFKYFHYCCDNYNDVGWGCAYRTLQSMCSWIAKNRNAMDVDANHHIGTNDIPSIEEIQQTLVNINDKPPEFLNSTDWLGALEIFYVIDTLYDISCRIQHIPSCHDIKKYSNILKFYFENFGGLVMMGGDLDASSKMIAGIHIVDNDAYLLVVDPHYVGVPKSVDDLIDQGYIRWQHTSDFVDSSFYNLCLPQLKFMSD